MCLVIYIIRDQPVNALVLAISATEQCHIVLKLNLLRCDARGVWVWPTRQFDHPHDGDGHRQAANEKVARRLSIGGRFASASRSNKEASFYGSVEGRYRFLGS